MYKPVVKMIQGIRIRVRNECLGNYLSQGIILRCVLEIKFKKPRDETIVISRVPVLADFGTTLPELSSVQVWANYAIVSNDERKRMACAPRDILIEQVQTAPIQSFNPFQNPNQSYDIRFSHAIKVLFFSVRNSYWSNYTTRETQCVGKADYEE